MPSEVRHLVDRDQAYPLVRLTGVLDENTAGPIRSVLLDVLADQPEAVVVDVAELHVTHPGAVAAFRGVLDETRDWPGAHLALTGAADAATWRPSGWPVWPDPAGAFGALGDPEPGHRISLHLEPLPGAARQSREVITEACGRWDQPELTGNACIVATEMVNNVVAHARTPMTVLLALDGDTMSVAVRDGSAVVPRFTGPVAPTSYGGRGLLLIDSVSSRWGHLALADGKVVWARLEPELPAASPASRRRDDAGMTDPRRG
ncbi:ATP-binding protein [Actinoplanes sp. DH11]|uniref:ATP-binding protein n=1 Tax=Actinoplanes sp. DH11 TaxID=2857011 RepID=UPI001E471EAF|nr:ATP-binding protein [Actinoplanes sp. DH11]